MKRIFIGPMSPGQIRNQLAVRLALLLIGLFALLPPTPDMRAAGPAFLVKEITPGEEWSVLSDLTNANGTLFFYQLENGEYRLWKSDGTETGTILLKTFVHLSEMTGVGDTLFFAANEVHSVDGSSKIGLWKSDGTPDGTVLVKEFPKPPTTDETQLSSLINVNGTLFFTSKFAASPMHLWRSDGTADGTVELKSFNAIGAMTNANGVLYFGAFESRAGVWRSDGTPTGTTVVKEILPETINANIHALTSINGTLFFVGNSTEFWKSDGTAAGTTHIMTLPEPVVAQLINVQGMLFFFTSVIDNKNITDTLWKSDGTAAGTRRISTYLGAPVMPPVASMVTVNDTLFLAGLNSQHGTALEKIHRTQNTPTLIKAMSGRSLANVCGTLFFQGLETSTGWELWKSDGTPAGTQLVQDIAPGESDSFPNDFTVAGNYAFFAATEPATGRELWAMPLPTATFTPTTAAHQLFLPLISNLSSYDGSCG